MNYLKQRKKKDLKQWQVAEKAGISLVAYRMIECGVTKTPKPETLKALKEILGE